VVGDRAQGSDVAVGLGQQQRAFDHGERDGGQLFGAFGVDAFGAQVFRDSNPSAQAARIGSLSAASSATEASGQARVKSDSTRLVASTSATASMSPWSRTSASRSRSCLPAWSRASAASCSLPPGKWKYSEPLGAPPAVTSWLSPVA
jgi:hypothetical protein